MINIDIQKQQIVDAAVEQHAHGEKQWGVVRLKFQGDDPFDSSWITLFVDGDAAEVAQRLIEQLQFAVAGAKLKAMPERSGMPGTGRP